jgi:uncharacterized protein YkwD
MKTNLRNASALIALVSSVCMLAAEAQTGKTSPNPAEKELARLIVGHPKQERVELKLDPILQRVARRKALDMARRGYFSHTTPEGVGPNLAVRRAGYRLPTWYSKSRGVNNLESISAGYTSPTAVLDAWLRSQEHSRHLFGADEFYRSHNRFGVGIVEVPGSPYQRYYVFLTAPAQVPKTSQPTARNESFTGT